MARLIDADNAAEILCKLSESLDRHSKDVMVMTALYLQNENDFPTIEPKRGRWIVHTDKWASGAEYFGYAECSVCGDKFNEVTCIGLKPMWDYCPNCGAKMREVEE